MEPLHDILREHGVEVPEKPTQEQVDNIVEVLEAEVRSTLEEIEREMSHDPRYVVDEYVPMLINQLEAIDQIQHMAPHVQPELATVKTLLEDYGLWVGLMIMQKESADNMTPIGYLAASYEGADEVPDVALAREFLEQFYQHPDVIDQLLLEIGYLKGEVTRVK